jgi:hypothetical protein
MEVRCGLRIITIIIVLTTENSKGVTFHFTLPVVDINEQ